MEKLPYEKVNMTLAKILSNTINAAGVKAGTYVEVIRKCFEGNDYIVQFANGVQIRMSSKDLEMI